MKSSIFKSTSLAAVSLWILLKVFVLLTSLGMHLVCRIERQYGIFTRMDACSYVLNIFDDGNVLSIVTDCSPHGTHVAGITAAHHPEVCVFITDILGRLFIITTLPFVLYGSYVCP